jgi:hypothetical protein
MIYDSIFLYQTFSGKNYVTWRYIAAALEWQPQRIVWATQGGRRPRLPVDSIKFHVTTTENKMINPLRVNLLLVTSSFSHPPQVRNGASHGEQVRATGEWNGTLQLLVR